jgi:hypothetical protein
MTNPNIHMSFICRINKGALMCFHETMNLPAFLLHMVKVALLPPNLTISQFTSSKYGLH